MNEEHRKVIENTIQDSFKLKDRFHDFEANFSGQLLFEHLDLLKNLASIIIAVIGIGYLLGRVGINVFSTSAFLFSIVSLIFIFSYIREVIDRQAKGLKTADSMIKNKTDEAIEKAVEAIKKDDASISFDYAKKEYAKIKDSNSEMNYAGEIALFLFYCILFSVIGIIFAEKFPIDAVLQWLIFSFILAISWQMSFREWSIRLVGIFSKNITNSLQQK